MRITDFELQTQSGQLWLDIVERITAKDEEIATLVLDRDSKAARLVKFLATAQEALAAGDLDTLKTILNPVVEDEKQTEEERKKSEIRAKVAELRAEADKLESSITIKK